MTLARRICVVRENVRSIASARVSAISPAQRPRCVVVTGETEFLALHLKRARAVSERPAPLVRRAPFDAANLGAGSARSTRGAKHPGGDAHRRGLGGLNWPGQSSPKEQRADSASASPRGGATERLDGPETPATATMEQEGMAPPCAPPGRHPSSSRSSGASPSARPWPWSALTNARPSHGSTRS